jgi:hypothetical protein
MSAKDRERLKVLHEVGKRHITQVRPAKNDRSLAVLVGAAFGSSVADFALSGLGFFERCGSRILRGGRLVLALWCG